MLSYTSPSHLKVMSNPPHRTQLSFAHRRKGFHVIRRLWCFASLYPSERARYSHDFPSPAHQPCLSPSPPLAFLALPTMTVLYAPTLLPLPCLTSLATLPYLTSPAPPPILHLASPPARPKTVSNSGAGFRHGTGGCRFRRRGIWGMIEVGAGRQWRVKMESVVGVIGFLYRGV